MTSPPSIEFHRRTRFLFVDMLADDFHDTVLKLEVHRGHGGPKTAGSAFGLLVDRGCCNGGQSQIGRLLFVKRPLQKSGRIVQA